MHKILLSLLLPCAMQQLHGMQQITIKTDAHQQCRVIEGDVYLIANSPVYRGYATLHNIDNLVDAQGVPLQIRPEDVMVQVCVVNDMEKKYDWDAWGVQELRGRTFPTTLPLFLLMNKQEGDTIAFFFKNPESKEIFKIKLLCKQYRYHDSFQGVCNDIMWRFFQRANCYVTDVEQLLKTGVLEANKKYDKNASDSREYNHGPHGFKMADLYKAQSELLEQEAETDYQLLQEESGDIHVVGWLGCEA